MAALSAVQAAFFCSTVSDNGHKSKSTQQTVIEFWTRQLPQANGSDTPIQTDHCCADNHYVDDAEQVIGTILGSTADTLPHPTAAANLSTTQRNSTNHQNNIIDNIPMAPHQLALTPSPPTPPAVNIDAGALADVLDHIGTSVGQLNTTMHDFNASATNRIEALSAGVVGQFGSLQAMQADFDKRLAGFSAAIADLQAENLLLQSQLDARDDTWEALSEAEDACS